LSIHAPLPPPPTSLDAIVAQAGGVCATRDRHTVVTSYGSPAGELAACVTAVGLADCSQLTKLLLDGPPAQVRELTSRLAGAELAPGGLVSTGAAWWCAVSARQTLVLCDPGCDNRVRAAIAAQAGRQPCVWVSDRTAGCATLAVVGRRARDVLAALGVYGPSGDPRAVPPVIGGAGDGGAATWVLQTDDEAWAVLPRADAPALWHAIERAGQPFSLCAVGQDAIARYALIGRSTATR
jgi:glycine cleavage system aminomethyltransferase T